MDDHASITREVAKKQLPSRDNFFFIRELRWLGNETWTLLQNPLENLKNLSNKVYGKLGVSARLGVISSVWFGTRKLSMPL